MAKRTKWVRLFVLLLMGCGSASIEADANTASLPHGTFRLVDARSLDGASFDLAVIDGTIVPLDALPANAPQLDAGGATVLPSFVDAHVHFSYLGVAERHAAGGIAAAIDLAAPLDALANENDPLLVLRAGPMITSPGGYPLESWGSDGYGIACADAYACVSRVGELIEHGADIIKVAAQSLDDASLLAVVGAAHDRGRLVVAHALSARDAERAARAGVDILAHTPTETLDDDVIGMWRERSVITTLGAFRGDAALENLRRLREAGANIVYGTDLGNSRTPGIDAREIGRMLQSGMDLEAIVASATVTPARIFDLRHHGSLSPGHAASFLLYRGDLHADATLLARPDLVVQDGEPR